MRRDEVTAPYGPSATTHVPIASCCRPREASPSALTVRRSVVAVGGADSENGVGGRPVVGSEEAPAEELAGLRPQLVEVLTLDEDRHDAGALGPDFGDAHAVPGGLLQG